MTVAKKIINYVLIFIMLIVLYNILLYIVYAIPNSASLFDNCLETANFYIEEGDYYTPLFVEKIDNAMDTIIISQACSVDSEHPVESYMLSRRNYNKEITKVVIPTIHGNMPTYSLNTFSPDGEPVSDSEFGIFTRTKELRNFLLGKVEVAVEYARYWHGYMLLFRPLLFFFNLQQIRIIIYSLFLLLFIAVLHQIYKVFGKEIFFAFGASMLCCEFFIAVLNFGQFPSILLTLLSSYAMIKLLQRSSPYLSYFFFIIGSLICFFDF